MSSGNEHVVPPLTLGTAGHIDHGKTALIGALTGKNTDRLEQEQRRGISIELGYAELELPSRRRISVVDVPGHERFVRTMVAGASGIDLYLLCVAADDGVMPQTREHLTVLSHLGITTGVVCVTKADIGEPDLAAEEVTELVPDAEVAVVSVVDRTGLDDLRAALDRAAERISDRADRLADGGCGRLFVDRSFTLRGIGTVVTGTLWSGRFTRGDEVTVMPRGLSARVRSVQVHDRAVDEAHSGQRVALNLSGVGWRDVGRGDAVLCRSGGGVSASYLLDVKLALEAETRPLERGARVHVHHGTLETPARAVSLEADSLEPGRGAYAQLRLDHPAVAAYGDRVVLRQLAPPDTIGGGVVIDPSPKKHGARRDVVARLQALERGERPPEPAPRAERQAISRAQAPPTLLDEPAQNLAALLRQDWREPRSDGDLAAACGLKPADAQASLRVLVAAGRAVRVARNLHFDPGALSELRGEVLSILDRDGATTIATVRNELSTSRKFAQTLLEHLDAEKVTVRRGDEHVLRRRRV